MNLKETGANWNLMRLISALQEMGLPESAGIDDFSLGVRRRRRAR
jgi:hypothetical protein